MVAHDARNGGQIDFIYLLFYARAGAALQQIQYSILFSSGKRTKLNDKREMLSNEC